MFDQVLRPKQMLADIQNHSLDDILSFSLYYRTNVFLELAKTEIDFDVISNALMKRLEERRDTESPLISYPFAIS